MIAKLTSLGSQSPMKVISSCPSCPASSAKAIAANIHVPAVQNTASMIFFMLFMVWFNTLNSEPLTLNCFLDRPPEQLGGDFLRKPLGVFLEVGLRRGGRGGDLGPRLVEHLARFGALGGDHVALGIKALLVNRVEGRCRLLLGLGQGGVVTIEQLLHALLGGFGVAECRADVQFALLHD